MRTIGRHAVLTLAVVAATLASATGALAADHHGLYGVHYPQDSAEYPGAFCLYRNDEEIRQIRVRFPIVFARDRTPGRDSQLVAWKFWIERSPDGTAPWVRIIGTPFQRATAFDDSPALFTRQSSPFPVGPRPGVYRVLVRMRWYQPQNETLPEGGVTHVVQWYDGTPTTPAHWCPGMIA